MERTYTIPLRKAKQVPRKKRAPRAIKFIKSFLARHMKTSEDMIYVEPEINKKMWERGIEKPPSKIRVKSFIFSKSSLLARLPMTMIFMVLFY